MVASALADVDFLASGFGPAEELGAAERVIDENVRHFDAFLGAEGDKA
jgi:hypothetical protein